MNCNEFILPILSVIILKEGTDIIYNVPATVSPSEPITLSESANTGYARIIKSAGSLGTALIAEPDSFSISSTLSAKQSGNTHKVTLEYKVSSSTEQTSGALNPQQSLLTSHSYSLLLEFFDGTRGLVRCYPHGDGYSFLSKLSEGTYTNTIAIHNTTGILRIS